MNILLIMRCCQDDSFVFHVLTKDNVTLFIFSVVNKTDALVGRFWSCCVKIQKLNNSCLGYEEELSQCELEGNRRCCEAEKNATATSRR